MTIDIISRKDLFEQKIAEAPELIWGFDSLCEDPFGWYLYISYKGGKYGESQE